MRSLPGFPPRRILIFTSRSHLAIAAGLAAADMGIARSELSDAPPRMLPRAATLRRSNPKPDAGQVRTAISL